MKTTDKLKERKKALQEILEWLERYDNLDLRVKLQDKIDELTYILEEHQT